MRVVFIGGTYAEFTRYCLGKGINLHEQVFVRVPHDIYGRCLCEECVEIVWGETGRFNPEVYETVHQHIAMGHIGG